MSGGLVIFDWDGTLVDSVGIIVSSMAHAADRAGIERVSDASVRQIIGLELSEAIATLFPSLSAQGVAHVREHYVEAYLSSDARAGGFFEGIPDLLDRLDAHGVMIAVATGKSRRGLDRAMKALGAENRFCATICADETAGKPDPAMIFTLASRIDLPLASTVMVGDTTHDLEMARRADVRAIGVHWGAHDPGQLQACAGAMQCDTVSALVSTLNELGFPGEAR